jgi:choice-of-anchor B domain-containing protein
MQRSHENLCSRAVALPGARYSLFGAAFAAVLVAVAAGTAWGHDPVKAKPANNSQRPEALGHSTGADPETKRIETTGQGMPSVKGPFPDTLNMEFLGQVTNADMGLERLVFTGASFLSDIWGWTSPAGQEYAIVGTTSGVVFVRVTDPTNPEYLGIVPTTNPNTTRNFWWDLKSYQNYLYWTTEVNNAGVGIFDLSRLDALTSVAPGTPLAADGRWGVDPVSGTGPDPVSGYIRAHNIAINPAVARAYLIGVSKDPNIAPTFGDDGIVILDLTDPLNPVEVSTISGVDIDSHDAQIVTYQGPDLDHFGKEILFNYNGGELNVQIWDVSDPANPMPISAFSYPGASFTHQGWLTEDQSYVLVGDEEDELFGVSDPRNPLLPDTARTYICDARDLDLVECYGSFDSPAASIDHNLFVKGDKVYQAHYTAGIRVLGIGADGLGRIALSEIAHMDTEPRLPNEHMNHNINIFVGPWGVFPFFDSGTIAASDGLNGLILMSLADD